MTNIFLIEAKVKESGNSNTVVKYLGFEERVMSGNEFTDRWKDRSVAIFPSDLNKAVFFNNFQQAGGIFNSLVEDLLKPNDGGKVMFIPPLSDLVGGEHRRRTILIELQLLNITGIGLAKSTITPISEVTLIAEEYKDRPYSVKTRTPVNMVIEDNMIGDYNVTPPVLAPGDQYYSTRINTVLGEVVHECWDSEGRTVTYICSKKGNFLHRIGV